jgi:hypothetical protein
MNQSRSWIKTGWNPNNIPQLVEVKTGKTLDAFESNDVDKVSNDLLYDGGEDKDGSWCIQSVAQSGSVLTLRFATKTNNPTYSNYLSAWTDRAVLTYGLFSEAF